MDRFIFTAAEKREKCTEVQESAQECAEVLESEQKCGGRGRKANNLKSAYVYICKNNSKRNKQIKKEEEIQTNIRINILNKHLR